MSLLRRAVAACAALAAVMGPFAAQAQAVPTSTRMIQPYCNERVRGHAESDFKACVDRETIRLREHVLGCTKQAQIQDVRSADLVAYMSRCVAEPDFSQFQQQQAQQAEASGRKLGREYDASTQTLAAWTNFDGAVTLRRLKVLLAQWVGDFESGLPSGKGELLAEVQYVSGILVDTVQVGVVHLQGTMNAGVFVGPVAALKHPAWRESKDRATVNDFAAGRSLGLAVNSGPGCDTSSLVIDAATRAEFIGTCQTGRPYQGLVIYEYKGQGYDMACLAQGKVGARNELDAFEPCASFWRHLPGSCQSNNYKGQCRDGRPHGVGVMKTVATQPSASQGGGILAAMPNLLSPGIRSYYLMRGMFAGGELSGFGYYGLMEGCGMAGCSGDRGEQVGWFEKGQLKFSCATMQSCEPNLSGADYTRWLGKASGGPGGPQPTPGQIGDFGAAMIAFRESGDRQYLRLANEMARSVADRVQMEFELLRIAGFDKAFVTSAELVPGAGRAVDFSERERVLGFVRSTDGSVPLRVNWRVRNDSDAVEVRLGTYSVRALIGVRARLKRTSCVGSLCNEQMHTDLFERQVNITIDARRREAGGQFDLRQTANSASMTFGSPTVDQLVDIEPFVRVDSVTLVP